MIYIIVPVFNRANQTLSFLRSCYLQSYNDFKLIIVNDGSSDETLEVIDNFKNDIDIFVIHTFDLWWCGSINKGINFLNSSFNLNESDIVVFCNNDVTFGSEFFDDVVRISEEFPLVIGHPQTFLNSGKFASSGAWIKSWFPFITSHPKGISNTFAQVHLGTARFLFMKFGLLSKVGIISTSLKQYQGDNDFTYRAYRLGIPTYIFRDLVVGLEDSDTGAKDYNIFQLSQLINSFISIKSPNNLSYRYKFLRNHFSVLSSIFILFGMIINIFSKFFIYSFKKKIL